MRTAGQGQAAVPWERGHRRRENDLAWGVFSGPLDKILRTVTAVERYPDTSPFWRKYPVLTMGALCEPWFFSAQNGACVYPLKSK